MLSEPRKLEQREQAVQVRKDKQTGRFQIVKLEERIAPRFGPDNGCLHGKAERSGKC